jgi:hypothetical protein
MSKILLIEQLSQFLVPNVRVSTHLLPKINSQIRQLMKNNTHIDN